MKPYQKPEVEILEIGTDVIATSAGTNGQNNNMPDIIIP